MHLAGWLVPKKSLVSDWGVFAILLILGIRLILVLVRRKFTLWAIAISTAVHRTTTVCGTQLNMKVFQIVYVASRKISLFVLYRDYIHGICSRARLMHNTLFGLIQPYAFFFIRS